MLPLKRKKHLQVNTSYLKQYCPLERGENRPSTYTLIKLPPLSSSDKAFAIRVPGHTSQTVFMGLGHFGPQLPRLVNKRIDREEEMRMLI